MYNDFKIFNIGIAIKNSYIKIIIKIKTKLAAFFN